MRNFPTVAIVDDDDAVRDALCDLLIVSGIECRSFSKASDFLTAHESNDFDCLITDIHMPEISGIDLLEKLKETSSKLPVIVLTSIQDEKICAKAMKLGARCWLVKPAAEGRLLREVDAAMEGRL